MYYECLFIKFYFIAFDKSDLSLATYADMYYIVL